MDKLAEEILLKNESLFQEHPFEEMYHKDKDAILLCMQEYYKAKMAESEIKHSIPFKCPECGEIIQYGLSDEGMKLFANSRLFKSQNITDADIEAWAEEKYKTWTHKSWTRTFVKMRAVEAAKAALNGKIKHLNK